MNPVRVTARAKREADRAERWWREHRPGSPELFRSEVERGIETPCDESQQVEELCDVCEPAKESRP